MLDDFLKYCWLVNPVPTSFCYTKTTQIWRNLQMHLTLLFKFKIFWRFRQSFVAFPECMNFNFWTIYDKIGHSFKKRCHKPNHQLRLTVDYTVFHPGRSLLEILKLRQIFLIFFEVTHDYIISLFVKMHGEFLFDFLILRK